MSQNQKSISECASCSELTVRTGNNLLGTSTNGDITQSLGTDASGCATLAISCTVPTGLIVEVMLVSFFILYSCKLPFDCPNKTYLQFSKDDIGTIVASDGAAAATSVLRRTLTCNSDGNLVYTSTTGSKSAVVNQVECVYFE